MNQENFAFDQNKLKEILTYHLNGNEYRLFDFISYKCRVNNNWWEYTDKQWEEVTGMNHKTFLLAKKSLEKKKIILNLNKGQRTKNSDGTINNKRNRLTINVEYILTLNKKKEVNPNFKSNLTKISKIDTMADTSKGVKSTLMEEENKTKGVKQVKTKGVKSTPDNKKSIKQDINITNPLPLNTTLTPTTPEKKEESGSVDEFKKNLDSRLQMLTSTNNSTEYRSCKAEWRSLDISRLSPKDRQYFQDRYDGIVAGRSKYFKNYFQKEEDMNASKKQVCTYIFNIDKNKDNTNYGYYVRCLFNFVNQDTDENEGMTLAIEITKRRDDEWCKEKLNDFRMKVPTFA